MDMSRSVVTLLLSLSLSMLFASYAHCDEVDDLILELGSSDSNIRSNAVNQLGMIGGEKAVAAIVSILGDKNEWVKLSAIISLTILKDPSTIPAVKGMLDDEKAVVVTAALGLLSQMDALPDCDSLIRLSRHDDPQVRGSTANHLAVNCSGIAFHRLMEMLDDEDPGVGAAAVRALALTNDPDAAEVVGGLLVSGDVTLRVAALEYFTSTGLAGYTEDITALLDDPDTSVRLKAASTLDALGWSPTDINDNLRYLFAAGKWDELAEAGSDATDILVHGLDTGDIKTRRSCAASLQKLGWKPVKDDEKFAFYFALKDWAALRDVKGVEGRMGEMLLDPVQGIDSRSAAAEGLGEMGTDESAGILVDSIARMNPDKDMMLIFTVSDALRKLGATAFPEVFRLFEGANNCGVMMDMLALAETDEEKSREAMEDAMESMKGLMAAMGLIRDMGPEAASYLADGLSHQDPSVRCNCIMLLSVRGSEHDHKYIVRMISDPDPDVRATALVALTELDSIDADEAEAPILAAMDDENTRVRYSATVALGKLKTEKALDKLIEVAGSEDSSTRRLAAAGLGMTEDPKAVPALLVLAGDPVKGVAGMAVTALAQIDDEASSDALAEIIMDPTRDQKIRIDALMSITNHHNPRAAEVVAAALDSEDRLLRVTAYRMLSMTESPDKLSLLIRGLSDESGEVRAACAYGLSSLGDQAAVKPLIGTLNDPNRQVRSAALSSLGSIGGPDAIEAITSIVYESTDDVMRGQAIYSLSYSSDPQAMSTLEQMAASDDGFISQKARSVLDSARAMKKYRENMEE